jgi:hypothetical protein
MRGNIADTFVFYIFTQMSAGNSAVIVQVVLEPPLVGAVAQSQYIARHAPLFRRPAQAACAAPASFVAPTREREASSDEEEEEEEEGPVVGPDFHDGSEDEDEEDEREEEEDEEADIAAAHAAAAAPADSDDSDDEL